MGQNPFQGMDIEREEAKRYGRFKALRSKDFEDLNEEDTARKVVETVEEELDKRIEQMLQNQGHVSEEEEISHEKFQEVHKRIENIENEWEAAFKGKEYSEVEMTDIKVLENLLSWFIDSLRYELKITAYIESLHAEISSLDIDQDAVEAFLGLEESESSEVGKHLQSLNKKKSYDLASIQQKVDKKLQNRQEALEEQIEKFKEQKKNYRNHLEILEAVEKELEEIRQETDEEKVEKHASEVQDLSHECIRLTLDLIQRKQEVLEEHTQAKKLKKNVNKLFFNRMV